MTSATYQVEVTQADAEAFAQLSGDWNPLHTNSGHASLTAFRQPVLHGAFSAGLVSRLAGMYLPGSDCLLHSMRLRFVSAIKPPASLIVHGRLAGESGGLGRVEVTISDATHGIRYVEATYEFSRHQATAGSHAPPCACVPADTPTLVTGASGGLGGAVLSRLGPAALGVSRRDRPGMLQAAGASDIASALGGRKIGGIVHCAWPMPDNESLLDLTNPDLAVAYQIAHPLTEMLALGQVLATNGLPDAMLVLVGSTFAEPGRHGYRMPLYTLAKSLVPTLTRILALELAPHGRRVASVVFDVIEGGMNKGLGTSSRQAHADRTPAGRLPDPDEAAEQIAWVLDNRSHLVSGATLVLSGGALP